MMLLAVGCTFRGATIDLREKLAFAEQALPHALAALTGRYGCEAVILSTCNRVELYLARVNAPAPLDAGLVAEFLGEWHKVDAAGLLPHLEEHQGVDAVRHLFRVAASLDSMIVGEGQIAGQVKHAYELAQREATAGPILHALFQQARVTAKRVRTETGIAHGHVSVSSAAVDYVRQVFERFDDKTVLVIGAGKMGELTLQHLRQLRPKRIWVTNRSPEKAATVAAGCGGQAVPWEGLDDALVRADIVLSTTGAPDVIVTAERWEKILARRSKGTVVILDIAVPRDFDPRIHDGDQTCLFNIDDLKRIREQTLQERGKHIAPAEAIVEQEVGRFVKDWQRRRHGPVIARLTREFEARRAAEMQALTHRYNGQLTDDVRADVEAMLRREHNHFLHVLFKALEEEKPERGESGLLQTLRKLFGLPE